MKLKKTDKLEIIDRKLIVNGETFMVQHPDEPLYCIKNGKLETIVFKACGFTCYQWDPEEIEGYFQRQETPVK